MTRVPDMVEALGHHSEQGVQAPRCTSATRFLMFSAISNQPDTQPPAMSGLLRGTFLSLLHSSPVKSRALFFSFPSCKPCGHPPSAEPMKSSEPLTCHSVLISCQVPGCLITWFHTQLPTPSGSLVSVICDLAVPRVPSL